MNKNKNKYLTGNNRQWRLWLEVFNNASDILQKTADIEVHSS